MKPISSYHNYLYESREFADVTLVSDDYHPVETHKTLLAHSSTIFRSLLYLSTDQKPIIYLKGVSHKELLALVKYIYLGEALLEESELSALHEVAKEYKVCQFNSNEIKIKAEKLDFLSQSNVKNTGTYIPNQHNKLNFLNFDVDSAQSDIPEYDNIENVLEDNKLASLENQEDFEFGNNTIIDSVDSNDTNQEEGSEAENSPSKVWKKTKNKKTEKVSECSVCAMKFTTLRSLQRHTKNIHELAFNEKCKFCDTTFHSRDNLRAHVKRLHGETKYIYCDKDKCDWKAKWGTKYHLKKHKIQNHHTGCDFCKITFEKDEELHQHIKEQHINKYL